MHSMLIVERSLTYTSSPVAWLVSLLVTMCYHSIEDFVCEAAGLQMTCSACCCSISIVPWCLGDHCLRMSLSSCSQQDEASIEEISRGCCCAVCAGRMQNQLQQYVQYAPVPQQYYQPQPSVSMMQAKERILQEANVRHYSSI